MPTTSEGGAKPGAEWRSVWRRHGTILKHAQDDPISALLGGRQSESVPDYFSISERTKKRLRQRIEIAGTNRKIFQLKLGIGSFEDDLDQVTLVLGEIGADQIVLADANGGWDADRACKMIRTINDRRLVWEEPCNTYEANRAVMERTDTPVMVDQCAASPGIAAKVVEEGFAHSLCIKPAFLGGLSVAQQVRDSCIKAGMKMRIDGPWCGDVAMAAILHLAAGAPPDLLISSCDLREPVLIEPSLGGVVSHSDTTISPPNGPGLGISDPSNALGPPDEAYGQQIEDPEPTGSSPAPANDEI